MFYILCLAGFSALCCGVLGDALRGSRVSVAGFSGMLCGVLGSLLRGSRGYFAGFSGLYCGVLGDTLRGSRVFITGMRFFFRVCGGFDYFVMFGLYMCIDLYVRYRGGLVTALRGYKFPRFSGIGYLYDS